MPLETQDTGHRGEDQVAERTDDFHAQAPAAMCFIQAQVEQRGGILQILKRDNAEALTVPENPVTLGLRIPEPAAFNASPHGLGLWLGLDMEWKPV
ncbi:hypothetical protein GCM10009628_16400 [Paeniglutamicibacter kerguelensis]